MEAYPLLPSKHYKEWRHELRSGDILLCSGNSLFSTLIQKATNSIWSHVGFILRIDAIDRVMVLESVETIGVRTIPLSHYLCNYNGTGTAYAGRIMIARHDEVKAEKIAQLSRSAIDFLGYPYRTEEIAHIAARLSLCALGFKHQTADAEKQRAFICSEYAHACFKSIGVTIDFNPLGFIAPADFAGNAKVKHLCYLQPQTDAVVLREEHVQ